MRETLLAIAAFVALAGPADAGGLGDPVYGAQGFSSQGFSWTGCYAGGHVGGLWGSSEKWIVETEGGAFEGQSLGGHHMESVIGGLQAGCDYQLANGFVLGVAGGYGWADARGTHPSAREFGVSYHSTMEGIGEVTGRVGYEWDRVLGYVKAGAAWERADYSASTIITGLAYKAEDTRDGWTVGAGGEYAISDRLSAFVEYGYYDFGTDTIRLTPVIPGLPFAFVGIEDTASVVRAGVNLRFGR
jgi:outer membrane immunogenic protein